MLPPRRKRNREVDTTKYNSKQEFMTVFYAVGDFLEKTTGCLSFCIISYSLTCTQWEMCKVTGYALNVTFVCRKCIIETKYKYDASTEDKQVRTTAKRGTLFLARTMWWEKAYSEFTAESLTGYYVTWDGRLAGDTLPLNHVTRYSWFTVQKWFLVRTTWLDTADSQYAGDFLSGPRDLIQLIHSTLVITCHWLLWLETAVCGTLMILYLVTV